MVSMRPPCPTCLQIHMLSLATKYRYTLHDLLFIICEPWEYLLQVSPSLVLRGQHQGGTDRQELARQKDIEQYDAEDTIQEIQEQAGDVSVGIFLNKDNSPQNNLAKEKSLSTLCPLVLLWARMYLMMLALTLALSASLVSL